MAKLVQRRRGSTADHDNFIGAIGEITVDTTLDTIRVHDGTTPKGFPLARQDMSNVSGNPTTFGGVGITQLNVNDGTAAQSLSTDGAGGLYFQTIVVNVSNEPVGGDVHGSVSNIQLNSNVVGIGELNVADGLVGQVLTTNGSGSLTFTNKAEVGTFAVGGDVSGTISNIQLNANVVRTTEIIDNAITEAKLAVNSISTIKIQDSSVTLQKLGTDCISTIKIQNLAVTDDKIAGMSASKLSGALPAIDGSNITGIHYDTSFAAGFDSDMLPEDLTLDGIYGEMVMSRSGQFIGEAGYIDNAPSGTALIVDVLKNGTTIYSSRPQFLNSNTMSSGTLNVTSFSSGDRITLKVIQIGSSTVGKGLRFTLNGKV
jgi:hypothetical protein